jgi:hypothetical protein
MTNEWFVEQQQLALHALHIFPRLLDVSSDEFLVQYDKMNTEELALVASLLDEPVKCWTLMKFDYTLLGIARLLHMCRWSQAPLKLLLETKSKTAATLDDGTVNPVRLLLRYQEISLRVQSHDALPSLSEEFWGVGSPSWAIKVQNLYALKLESASLRHKAVEIWELILDQSRNHTGSVFVHPTWMVFVNLEYQIRDNLERRQQLFEKFETEASREKDKVQRAAFFLEDLDQIRQMRRRQIAIPHFV